MVSFPEKLKVPVALVVLGWLALLLVSCGEAPTPRPTYIPPTPPPTPVDFTDVPNAATIASGEYTQPSAGDTPVGTSTEPTIPTTAAPGPGDENDPGFINADSTTLARIFGTPGPGSGQPGGNSSASGRPSRVNPTPTLNTGPGQTNIASLRTSKVSFLFAYRQALARIQAVQRQAVIVFASANNLKPDRTTWTFLFVWVEGRKMWRVVFDSGNDQPASLSLNEMAPTMLADAGRIDMTRVLDGDELVSRAEAAGLKVNLPVDIISFQVDGVSRQPSFVMTNSPQGKQVVINAYTGQVTRNDFKE